MEAWWTYACCGLWLIAPMVTFALGFKVGREGLPWRVRIERAEGGKFAVED